MQDQLRLLLELQEVDEAIARARIQQKKLPEKVAEEYSAFSEAEQEVQEAEAAFAEREKARRGLEAELAENEAHMVRLKSHIKEITNTREYQAYIQEMDGIQATIGKLEEQILTLLTDADQLKETLEGYRVVLEERRAVYEAERAKVDAELGVIEEDVVRQATERSNRADKVDKKLLRRYERIAQTMRHALVGIEGYTCSGCKLNVPPQLVSEVKRGEDIHQCPQCHRLLFAPEAGAEQDAQEQSTA
ncbi:MAG: zinc ribbon domain-containing protein [Leptospirillia bacterium]